jgi:hypothetical protein
MHSPHKAQATQFNTGNDYGSAYNLCAFYEALSVCRDCCFKETLSHCAAAKND